MMRIWTHAFWRSKCRATAGPGYRGMMLPAGVLVLFTIFMGIIAQPFVGLAMRAAEQVQNPAAYIDASYGKVRMIPSPPSESAAGTGATR